MARSRYRSSSVRRSVPRPVRHASGQGAGSHRRAVTGSVREGHRSSGAEGKLIVISAPSGAGKTTIAHEILRRNRGLEFSVSATTRPRRLEEVEGKDYFFLSKEEFRRRVDAGEFTEWEEIYGEYYGTLKSEIERARTAGRNLLFDIDVNGALSIKQHYPSALLIFIAPPSIDELLQRLRSRHTEDDTTLARRMARVPMEMSKGEKFDVRVVNDTLERAVDAVQKIVEHTLQTS